MDTGHDAVAVRPFRSQDAEACFRIRSEAFIVEFYSEVGPEAVAAAVNGFMPSDYISMGRKRGFFVAEFRNEPIGFCVIRILDTTTAELLFIYVHRRHRGLGIGTRLVSFAESWLREDHAGLSQVILDTVVPGYNQGFYEKLGYKKVGEHPHEFPGKTVRAVRLQKAL